MADAKLPVPVAQLFEPEADEARLQRVWRRIQTRRAERKVMGRARLMLAAGCGIALLAVLLATFWHGGHDAAPVALNPSAPAPVGGAIVGPSEFDFGDGALVKVDNGGILEVRERSPRVVSLVMRAGLARFDVRPGGQRTWRIDCGQITVEVLGTRFLLERKGRWARVEVERGRVLVRGEGVEGHQQVLVAGDRLVVDGTIPPVEGASATAPSARIPAHRNLPAPAEWVTAARSQEWKRAWEVLGESGVAREMARADDVAELLTLADVARLSGHPNEAVAPLQRVVREHADDTRAPLAAFTLGRLLLDSVGNPGAAADALERAVALRLPATLAEDAEARLVEAYARAGNREKAAAHAAAYRARYPEGRRTAEVDRWSPF